MEKIKIMIAEDHPVVLDGLAAGIVRENMVVIGAALNGQKLLDLLKENIPDVVLLDIRMPILDGFGVLKVLNKDYPSVRVIMFSSEFTPFNVALTIVDGAAAFLSKDAYWSEILEAIESVYRDGFYFNKHVSEAVLRTLRDHSKKLYYLIEDQRFSEREIEILKMFCNEVPFEQIGEILSISKNTVLDHKKNLFKKTESNNIVSLVKYAIKQGIVGI